MISDPCLWNPDTSWVQELFRNGKRLYLLRYAIPSSSPLDTEPLMMELSNKKLAILCTQKHLERSAFKEYMRNLGADPNQWTTISFSNFESFFFHLLVLRRKRPEISGVLVDPPKSAYTAFSRTGGIDMDMVLMLPERETIVDYLNRNGMDIETILTLESQITDSMFKDL